MATGTSVTSCSHIVCLFCVTAGQNGENLGSDEEQIVLFVYLLYDIADNKVVTLHVQYVRPTPADDVTTTENILTEECRIQTNLPEDSIKNAQPLEHVLDDFERFLCSKSVHPDHGGRPFMFCTDGQLHLRMCLLPEALRKNIALPAHFYKFFDLRKEFKKFYKTERPMNCIKDMLDFLGLEADQSLEYGVRHCQQLSAVLHRLVNDGHLFVDADIIKDKLEPGVCSCNDEIDDETVVRARGLPWQSSDQDIARFFTGLNVARGGVALCLSQQGRRNGEALIRFESKEHRDLALRRHKHHIGQRYIEVYRATGHDFISVAGGSCSEAQEFLSRHVDLDSQVIVRMRGLPYTCTAQQVLEFFKLGLTSVDVLDGEDGVLFVHQADGRATGDAFVLFTNDEAANKALSKHRQCIGNRYIELFKSTTAEVQQVLNRSLDPRMQCETQDQSTSSAVMSTSVMSAAGPVTMFYQQQLITCGTSRDCVRVRGLPLEADVADVLNVLGECSRNIVLQGVHLVYNSMGMPSGEAFVQMDSEYSAELAAVTKNKKVYVVNNKKRYIEVIQCSGDDMNYALTAGLPPPPPPTMPVAALSCGQPALPLPSTPLILPPPNTTFIPAQRQLMSTIPPGTATILAPPGSFPAACHMPFHSPPTIHNTCSTMSPVTPTNAIVPTMSMPSTVYTSSPRHTTSLYQASHQTFAAFQPSIIYWYPSPPVSPQSTYYIQPTIPTSVMMKGLPANTQPHDILAFVDGLVELVPDIQFILSPDGRPTGDAFVTFSSRLEAERVVSECTRKLIANCFIDMQII